MTRWTLALCALALTGCLDATQAGVQIGESGDEDPCGDLRSPITDPTVAPAGLDLVPADWFALVEAPQGPVVVDYTAGGTGTLSVTYAITGDAELIESLPIEAESAACGIHRVEVPVRATFTLDGQTWTADGVTWAVFGSRALFVAQVPHSSLPFAPTSLNPADYDEVALQVSAAVFEDEGYSGFFNWIGLNATAGDRGEMMATWDPQ